MRPNAAAIKEVLRAEHKQLRKWRKVEIYTFPLLQRLLDQLNYPKDASIGFILEPLSQASKQELPKVLDGIAKAILERARG
ncbi:MAG: hypothetical protein GWN58_27905 [Anaerolineae bacterium]|nr:hypothetical protein [Anaerolineae bacterium]